MTEQANQQFQPGPDDLVFSDSQIGKGMKPLAQKGLVVVGADGTFTLVDSKGEVIDSAPVREVSAKRAWYTGGQTVMLTLADRKYNTTPGWGEGLIPGNAIVPQLKGSKGLVRAIELAQQQA